MPSVTQIDIAGNPRSVTYKIEGGVLQSARGFTLTRDDPAKHILSPLAEHLFQMPAVSQVRLAKQYVTVERAEGKWSDQEKARLFHMVQTLKNSEPQMAARGERLVYEDMVEAFFPPHKDPEPRNDWENLILHVLKDARARLREHAGDCDIFRIFTDEQGVYHADIALHGSCLGCASTQLTFFPVRKTLRTVFNDVSTARNLNPPVTFGHFRVMEDASSRTPKFVI